MHTRAGILSYKQQLDLIKNFPAPQSPNGYQSFKGFFLEAILASFQGDDPETHRVMPYYNALLVHMLQSNTPTYYLTDEITEAAQNTKIPPVESDEAPFKSLNIFTPDGLTAAVKIQSMSDMHGSIEERYRWDNSAKKAGVPFNPLDAQVTFSSVIFVEDKKINGFHHLVLDAFCRSTTQGLTLSRCFIELLLTVFLATNRGSNSASSLRALTLRLNLLLQLTEAHVGHVTISI